MEPGQPLPCPPLAQKPVSSAAIASDESYLDPRIFDRPDADPNREACPLHPQRDSSIKR